MLKLNLKLGTCSVIGQAVGAAAYIAKKYDLKTPREVGRYIEELQQVLLINDCFLPEIQRKTGGVGQNFLFPEAARILQNGKDRDFADSKNKYFVKNGETLTYKLPEPQYVRYVKIVFDSDLNRDSFGDMHECEKQHTMRCNVLDDSPVMYMPGTLVKAFRAEIVTATGGRETLFSTTENIKRNLLLFVEKEVKEVRLTVEKNWGNSDESGIFTFELFD
ncbi:MAG: hypothetical protein SO532_05265 [Candidatus Borkfalkiaceae bacterium]|nr:hypothetical protein [Christensenellaceae bacterium]